jgi:hypothetical protein
MPKTTATPHSFRRIEAVAMLGGSRRLFDEMVAAGWLKPILSRHRLVLFDAGDVAKCHARIRNGEEPPRVSPK